MGHCSMNGMCGRTVLGPIGLTLLAISVNVVLGSQVQLAAGGGPRRSALSSGTACSADGQCGSKQFCLRPGLDSGAVGSCSSCWRCCLFPGVYGACPDSCGCVEGALCEARDGCSAGMFCSLADPWNLPNCQRCDTCTSNAYELRGSCSVPCASGDMGGLAALPHLTPQQYLFLSFLANEVSQQGAYVPTLLLRDELGSWLQGQGVGGEQANQTVFRMLGPVGDSNGFITAQDWMEAVTASTSLALLCPAYDPSLDVANQTRLVSEGCFCSASATAATFLCPAGQRCSRAAYSGLETDMLRAPTGQLLQAVCVPCMAGQYCGEGTYLADESDLSSLDCPSGYYCPSPGVKRECPAGAFCTERSTSAITCNYEKLLITDPYKRLPLEPETVVTRLRDKRDPLRGNYCPAQSTKPYEVCAAGYYCPNSSVQIICPKGHFCKAQSTVPWPCTYLTSCPEGTHVPSLSWMALVIAGIVLLGIPLIYFSLTQLDKSVLVEADDEAEKERDLHRSAAANRMTFRLLKSMKLSGNPLEDKYRGFGTVSPPINMEFDQLGLQIRPRGGHGEVKKVLSGVSGAFAPRRMNAILGPSGCGKTTFLNVLCGKITTGTLMGQVKINGDVMPVTRLRKIMGFVPQDDIVHEDLTVRENLNYSARMRLATDMDTQRRKHVVRDALEMLGLTAIQHYRVGTVEKRGISGGQRKRVNIGLELVAMPSLLFLDEPTSGLDATSSADILGSLVDMAGLGMNIIMVIHQPRFNSFCMFDQVLLLGTGGRTVYQGSPYAAVLYFDKHLGFKFPDRENPSDILMDIIAGKVHNENDPKLKNCNMLVEAWANSGAAWVELTEQLNPTMVFKMSEIDPEVIEDWSQQFDEVDEEQRGTLTASQLVTLFSDMGQDLALEDAIVLIKKVNSRRPASAAAKSHASSMTSAVDSAVEDLDSLVISKDQLLDALQGVREQHVQEDRGMGGGAGGGAGNVPLTPEQYQEMRLQREMWERNRPLSDEELDAMLPGEKDGYKILAPPAGYKPVVDPARKLMATPTPLVGGTPLYAMPEDNPALKADLPIAPEGLPEMKPEDMQFFSKLLQDVDEAELSAEEAKERKIMKLLLKVKNGTPPQRKSALRTLTDKSRELGAGPLFNAILPLLMQPTLEDQERHLLVKVIDRILYKLDELVRPYVHKILVVIEPLLIDEDYYARVEGREIIANLSKAAGLAQMIAAMRPDIDNIDEYVRNTTARAFSVVASALGIPALLPFLKAVCLSKKSWQARHTGIKIVQQIAILMGCAVLPHLRSMVDIVKHGLKDENQKVKTITALCLAALAEAATPYGIESFDDVLEPLWRGIRSLRGKVLAAFLKAIGHIIPLMDAEHAFYYTREVMVVLRREFATPDEEMKKIVLKVVKQCVGTEGVEPDYIRAEILPDFFKAFWNRRMALDRRNYKALVETTVALANKVGCSDIVSRVVEDLKDESEPYRRMVMETIDKVITELGAADVDARLEELLIDGILYAFQEQVADDSPVMLNGFGTTVNGLGKRARPYLPQICGTIKWRLNNKSAKIRQQAADLIARIAPVMKACDEEGLLGHLGVVLYEYLGEEYPEVLGSILGALKAIVNVIGMTRMTPPIKELLPRLTPILKNRHEKVQENVIDLVGRIADRGHEYVPAREWMRICFELLDMLKAHKKAIRRATVNTFGYIAKAIGPQDVLVTLLNNLKVQERQNRVCTTVAIAIVAESCQPFTVLPALMNEYRTPELNVQNGVLKALSFMFEYIGEMGKDYIHAVTPLLEDALMDRDLVHRQTAASVVGHMALGVAGLGCEGALTHLLNYVWPNIFEVSPHVVQAVGFAVDGCRVSLGPCLVLSYVLQGLWHPARKVRQVYWKLYNNLYIGAQDALVACYPAMSDEEPPAGAEAGEDGAPAVGNTYARHELDMML